MQILTADIGTGTQDIFLYDSQVNIENGFKLIVPSPTMIVHRRLKEATQRGEAVLLTGVTMGGGPSHWAARDHAKAGYPIYATPEAAKTFDDNLENVAAQGIHVISEDEAKSLGDSVTRLELPLQLPFSITAPRHQISPTGSSALITWTNISKQKTVFLLSPFARMTFPQS